MSSMIEILKKIDGLFTAPVASGTDEQNRILREELPFKILEYKSGREHNGWVVPDKWEVKKAEIRKDGALVYDGKKHPLGVIGYSQSFQGKITLAELKEHLFYKTDLPKDLVYHCDLYYKPYRKLWGFSVPYELYKSLVDGEYEIDLMTSHTVDTMKVLEYTHKGKSAKTIILNAHNCHAAQLNDGPTGYVVFTELMKRLQNRPTKYTYRLIVAPEHLGTVFYLGDLAAKEIAHFKLGIFMEMVGHENPKFALQESFTGRSLIDRIAHHVLRHKSRGYWSAPFRKIIGNDESVWEAAGYEVPTISLSRCEAIGKFYPEYHSSRDNIGIIREDMLEETLQMLLLMVDILEKDCVLRRRFTGLIALSNPKYDLYIQPGTDPSMPESVSQARPKWNYLMDCLPRYMDESMSVFDIAVKHDLPFDEVYSYLVKFRDKGLVEFIEKEFI